MVGWLAMVERDRHVEDQMREVLEPEAVHEIFISTSRPYEDLRRKFLAFCPWKDKDSTRKNQWLFSKRVSSIRQKKITHLCPQRVAGRSINAICLQGDLLLILQRHEELSRSCS